MDVFETLAEITKPNTYLADHRDIDQIIEESQRIIRDNARLNAEIKDLSKKIRKVINNNRPKQ